MNIADKTKTIAYADIVLLMLGMILVGIFGLMFAFEFHPEGPKGSQMKLHFVALQIRFVIAGIIQIILIFLLLEGVMLRNHKRCTHWILLSKLFLGLMLVSGIVKIFMDPMSVFLEILGCVYKIFCIRIVNPYAQELQNDSVFHP